MKLPRAIVHFGKNLIIRVKQVNRTTFRMAFLAAVAVICFVLVLPFIKDPTSNTENAQSQQVITPTTPPVTQLSPGNNPKENPPAATVQRVSAPAKGLSIKDFKAPMAGKIVRGTSKDLIWWDIFGDYRQHTGVDIIAPVGTRVVAAYAGKVTELGQDPAYGRVVVIEHGSGWQTVYGELQNIKVKLDQQVMLGQDLGQVGEPSGGEADLDSHLHYEVRQNQQILNGKD